jgi:uncharacterized protein (AIM24 family)
MVAFAARMPGEIVTFDIQDHPEMNYLCVAEALLCVSQEVEVGVDFTGKMGRGLYGNGFRMLSLTGMGRAWVAMSGQMVSYELRPDEKMRVHPAHVGVVQKSVTIDSVCLDRVKTPAFPDGLCLLEVTGPGRIWLTSMGVGALAEALDDYDATVVLEGVTTSPSQPKRSVIREALFPRP